MIFTSSKNYWLPGGDYRAETPVIAVGDTLLFIVMKVTLLTNIAAPWLLIWQGYPSAVSERTGPWFRGKRNKQIAASHQHSRMNT